MADAQRLREFKRLQSVVLAADQLLNQWGETSDKMLDKVEALQAQLEREPCVAERLYDERVANADDITHKRNSLSRSPDYGHDLTAIKRALD